jgi:hypothetical protein
MSETRALRDKLEETQAELRRTREHLEKLRAHHAREREALRQELEEARREVAELGARLERVERLGCEPPPGGPPRVAESLLAERSGGTPTALVALARSPRFMEEALPVLARLLKLSPVDVRFRLAPMLPTVLARLPVPEALSLRDALRAAGFAVVSCEVPPRAVGSLMTVREFTLEPRGLSVEGARGERQRMLYSQLRLLVRGRRATTTVEPGVELGFEENGAWAWKQVEGKYERVEQFLWLYGAGIRAAFSHETRFSGLGAQRGLSIFESLQRLMEELRLRVPHAVVDERFMQAPRFRLPLVDEERGQELLGELLFLALQEGLWE